VKLVLRCRARPLRQQDARHVYSVYSVYRTEEDATVAGGEVEAAGGSTERRGMTREERKLVAAVEISQKLETDRQRKRDQASKGKEAAGKRLEADEARAECGGAGICHHQHIRSKCKECGGASICQHQRIRSTCKECGGARTSAKGANAMSAGGRASASTSASGANARSAGAPASARTSASGANARSAARRRTRRCRPAWRSSRGQRMLLVKTCDLSHGPHGTDPKQSLIMVLGDAK